MVISKFYKSREDGARLMVTYSDKGYYIRKENESFLYKRTIDVYPVKYKYIETDVLIPVEEKETSTEEITKEE